MSVLPYILVLPLPVAPNTHMAERLRAQHHDTLLQLVEARRKLALAVDQDHVSLRRVDALLEMELGREDGSETPLLGAAADPDKSVNKQGLR